MREESTGTDPMIDKTSYITWDNIPHILACCRTERDRLFFLLAIKTARRVGELVQLKVQDIDFINECIAWNIEKKRKAYRCVLPIEPMVLDELRAYILSQDIPPEGWVFFSPNVTSKPLSIRRWQAIFERILLKSGVKTAGGRKPHFHSLRHSVAVKILEERGDIRLVQRMLQHSDMSITGHYLQVSPQDLREKMRGVLSV
jgi:integrase/recombinase XerD